MGICAHDKGVRLHLNIIFDSLLGALTWDQFQFCGHGI